MSQYSIETRLAAFLTNFKAAPPSRRSAEHPTWQSIQTALQSYGISHNESDENQSMIMERIDAMVKRGQAQYGEGVGDREQHHSHESSLRNSYAESMIAPSTLTQTTIGPIDHFETTSVAATDDASLHSRRRLVQGTRHLSLAGPSSSSGCAGDDGIIEEQRRRVRLGSADDVYTFPTLRPKPRKTTSRKMFEGFCEVVDFVMPIDVSEEKTSMKESSLNHLVHRRRR